MLERFSLRLPEYGHEKESSPNTRPNLLSTTSFESFAVPLPSTLAVLGATSFVVAME
jgi:hypothetical protein